MRKTKYTVKYTTAFKKDYKRAIKRGLKIELLEQVVALLSMGTSSCSSRNSNTRSAAAERVFEFLDEQEEVPIDSSATTCSSNSIFRPRLIARL